MKIAHLSDTHLGYPGQGFERPVEDPWRPGVHVRLREVDLMRGLERAVDRIVAHIRPELVIHSGDLFDSARPTAHMLNFAMVQLKRLPDSGIPVVIVEGNHSSPRDPRHGHTLQLLAHLRGITVICEDAAIVRQGQVVVHAFPHRAGLLGRLPSPEHVDPSCVNVLVAHGVADGWEFFKTGRPAPDLSIRACADCYDYLALGHCHRFAQVPGTTRAFYAGATSMVTWGDFRPGHRFGLNVVTFGAAGAVVERELIETRAMHAYGLDNAEGLSPNDVLDFLGRQAAEMPPDDAYCRVIVERLDPLARRELSSRLVEEIFGSAAALLTSLRAREQRWDAIHSGLVEGGDPVTRFRHLVAQTDGDEAFKGEVLELGETLLARAAERVAAEDLGIQEREEQSIE